MDEKTITRPADVPDEAKAVALDQLLRETETADGIKRTEELLKAFLEADAETAVALQPVMSKILPRFYAKVDMAKARERILAERKKTGYQSQNIDRVNCMRSYKDGTATDPKTGKPFPCVADKKKNPVFKFESPDAMTHIGPDSICAYMFAVDHKHDFKKIDSKKGLYRLDFPISEYAEFTGLSTRQAKRTFFKATAPLFRVQVPCDGYDLFVNLILATKSPTENGTEGGRNAVYSIFMDEWQMHYVKNATPFVCPPSIARSANRNAPWAPVIGRKLAYQVHVGLACHNAYETETAAKGYAETKITVAKLLGIMGMAKAKVENRKEREKIITPLERNLDALKEVGSWWYLRKDGTKAGKGELVYSDFKDACVVFRFHGEAYDIETEKALAKKQIKKSAAKVAKAKKGE